MKWLDKTTKRLLVGVGFAVFTLLSPQVSAEEYLCDARQSSTTALPVLDAKCPIGRGVWGKLDVNKPVKVYWVQCGILDKPMAYQKAKPLYAKTSKDVWLKPEEKGYRCLVGPYDSPQVAVKELQQIRTLPAYKDAFIRYVPQSAEPVMRAEKPMATSTPETKPQPKTIPNAIITSAKVSYRRTLQIDGTRFVVPYAESKQLQFYMENQQPWNRLNYADAAQLCSKINMSIISQKEWVTLTQNTTFYEQQWPMLIPYWSQEHTALYIGNAPRVVKDESLLNVLCAAPVSATQ